MNHCTTSRPLSLCAAALLSVPFITGAALAATGQPSAGGAESGGAAPSKVAPQSPAPAKIRPATISKAGKALHDVLRINQSYGAKLAAAKSAAQKQALVAEAKDKASDAINAQGLSVETYTEVLVAAQRDPAVRAQLLGAAGISTKK